MEKGYPLFIFCGIMKLSSCSWRCKMKKEFIKKIKKGLGSAHFELYQAENKEEYKDSLRYACLHDMSYSYVEESKGKYLYDLISVYEDKCIFLQEIKTALFTTKYSSVSLLCQYLDLLVCFYIKGQETTVEKILWEFYEDMLTHGRWTDKKYLCFECLCFALDEVSQLAGVKKIFQDIKERDLNQSNLSNFIFSCVHIKYKNQVSLGSKELRYKKDRTETSTPTFKEFLNIVKKKNQELKNWFLCSTEEEYKHALQYLKNVKDKKALKESIKEFQYSDISLSKEYTIQLLFDLIDRYDEEITEEIYFSLSRFKSKRVEELGVMLLQSKKTRCHGILMLMQNYQPKYQTIIEKAYRQVSFSFRYDRPSTQLLFRTIDFMDHTKKKYPDQILYTAYQESYDSFHRKYIVECMLKRNLLTKEIKEELKYDSNEGIQEFISYISLDS